MAFAKGYSMAHEYNFDGLGLMLIFLAVVWTVILAIGIFVLLKHRAEPFLRIRNITLAISAVATIHVYWFLCMIAYSLQGYWPCSTEFWVMSIYLPLGIALFHASNAQLLHISGLQKRYMAISFDPNEKAPEKKQVVGWRRLFSYSHVENPVHWTMSWITFGMVAQFFVTVTIFLVSRKFHSEFGFTAPDFRASVNDANGTCEALKLEWGAPNCEQAKSAACRRGWEWVPSIAWQFFWAWVFAPYLLWKLRGIKDVHGWRMQTIFCCAAGLPASPMWLTALYAPKMKIVNAYAIPPLWFVPSIFIVESCLIFAPCWQILKNRQLHRETLDIIAEWQQKTADNAAGRESLETTKHKPSIASTTSSRKGELYTMAALESALRANSQPLLIFAALKDFSGENIGFLSNVLTWKRDWAPSSPTRRGDSSVVGSVGSIRGVGGPGPQSPNALSFERRQFRKAIDIYCLFVSPSRSDFPINISYTHLKQLEAVFEHAATALQRESLGLTSAQAQIDAQTEEQQKSNVVAPFLRLWDRVTHLRGDVEALPDHEPRHGHPSFASNATTAAGIPISAGGISDGDVFSDSKRNQAIVETFEMTPKNNNGSNFRRAGGGAGGENDVLPASIQVPTSFGMHVFDAAEESIKYMVLTNTWPKFVNAGYANAHDKSILKKVRERLGLKK